MKTAKLVLREYQRLRKQPYGYLGKAYAQLRMAKERVQLDRLVDAGLIRLRIEPDDHCSWDDLAGDCYNVELNASSVPGGARTIKAQEKAERERAERDGVWGIISEYRLELDSDTWILVDSVWGFIGEDWRDECDLDLLGNAMDALKEALANRCPCCRRPGKGGAL